MKKLSLALISFALGCGAVHAQQKPQYTQYMTNTYLVNQAVAGVEDHVDIKLGYRTQWAGFQDAPKTMYLSGHAALGKPHNYYHPKGEHMDWWGIGGMVSKDETGPISNTSMLVTGSYIMGITRGSGTGKYYKPGIRMSTALSLGMNQFSVDGSKFRNTGNSFISANGDGGASDPTIVGARFTKLLPDASLSIWLFGSSFYFGASSQSILKNKIDLDKKGFKLPVGQGTPTQDARLYRHYLINAGYKVPVTNMIKFIPSTLIKWVNGAPVSVDINGRFDYNNIAWAGISYRHRDAMAALAGVVINRMFEVAYSFDFTTTEIRNYARSGTHEIIVGVRLAPRDHLRIAEQFWK